MISRYNRLHQKHKINEAKTESSWEKTNLLSFCAAIPCFTTRGRPSQLWGSPHSGLPFFKFFFFKKKLDSNLISNICFIYHFVTVVLPICTLSENSKHQFHLCLQSNQKITVHVNNEQSRNCCSSRGLSVFAVEVPARTKMVGSDWATEHGV